VALKDAVELIVEQMLEEAKDLEGTNDAASSYTRSTLRGYARQLKTCLKAAEGTEPPPQSMTTFAMPHLMSPAVQAAAEVEKFRGEFRKKREDRVKLEDDALGGDMIELLDYPGYDPTTPEYISTPSGGQVGQKILLPQGAFRLRRRDKKLVLVYDEIETQEAKKRLSEEGEKSEGGIILGSD
jgi:hypothetical protein